MARRYPALVLLSAIVGGILLTDLLRPPSWILVVALLGAAVGAEGVLVAAVPRRLIVIGPGRGQEHRGQAGGSPCGAGAPWVRGGAALGCLGHALGAGLEPATS